MTDVLKLRDYIPCNHYHANDLAGVKLNNFTTNLVNLIRLMHYCILKIVSLHINYK